MRSVIFISIFFISLSADAQQTPNYTMKLLNMYQINPAFAGVSDQLNVFSYYRSQWQSHDGSPKQFLVNANMPFYKLNGGIGMQVNTSFQAASRYNEVNLSYAYHVNIPNDILSAGISIGLGQVGINSSELVTPQGTYTGGINHNDPILDNDIGTSFYPSYTLGVFYAKDQFDAGFSMQNFIGQKTVIDNKINFNVSRHFDAFFMYYYVVNEEIVLQPSLHLQSNVSQFQLEIMNYIKYGNVFGGIGLRGMDNKSIESIPILGGIKFNNKYTIAYSFDVSVSKLRNTSEGSHEIMIRYDLNREINTGLPPNTYHNPRNL